MPIQVSETSPSETPNTLSASASCSVSNFPPLFVDLSIYTSGWSIPWSGISNEYTHGDYDLRYGDVNVKWHPDPPDNRNKGVFNDGCSEFCNLSETYWWIGPNDVSARNKAFIRNQDGHDSDNGSLN